MSQLSRRLLRHAYMYYFATQLEPHACARASDAAARPSTPPIGTATIAETGLQVSRWTMARNHMPSLLPTPEHVLPALDTLPTARYHNVPASVHPSGPPNPYGLNQCCGAESHTVSY